jgi:hypothetical protein
LILKIKAHDREIADMTTQIESLQTGEVTALVDLVQSKAQAVESMYDTVGILSVRRIRQIAKEAQDQIHYNTYEATIFLLEHSLPICQTTFSEAEELFAAGRCDEAVMKMNAIANLAGEETIDAVKKQFLLAHTVANFNPADPTHLNSFHAKFDRRLMDDIQQVLDNNIRLALDELAKDSASFPGKAADVISNVAYKNEDAYAGLGHYTRSLLLKHVATEAEQYSNPQHAIDGCAGWNLTNYDLSNFKSVCDSKIIPLIAQKLNTDRETAMFWTKHFLSSTMKPIAERVIGS